MNKAEVKRDKREKRHRRIRAKIIGEATRPRLAVYRSNRYIYAQLIDDRNGKTLLSSSDLKSAGADKKKSRAEAVGKAIADGAMKKGIKEVVFDRGGFNYTGRIKLLADAARAGGLKF